jgi:hypothetical protein
VYLGENAILGVAPGQVCTVSAPDGWVLGSGKIVDTNSVYDWDLKRDESTGTQKGKDEQTSD